VTSDDDVSQVSVGLDVHHVVTAVCCAVAVCSDAAGEVAVSV